MGYRILTQLGMIGASLFIIFAVIAPQLEDIKKVEDKTAQIKKAADNASAYNTKLTELSSQKNSFTKKQLEDLERFMPSEVDGLRVMADLQNMTELAGLEVQGIAMKGDGEDFSESFDETEAFEYDEMGEPVAQAGPRLQPTDFTVTASGAYFNIKQLLGSIEFNNYPLEVVDIAFVQSDAASQSDESSEVPTEPTFAFTITLRTYSLGN